MSTDPRVAVVAEALLRHNDPKRYEQHPYIAVEAYEGAAEVAVAALDAYDASQSPYTHRTTAQIEADLRERIASEIDQEWAVARDQVGRRPDAYDEGWLDGVEHAARIARGQQ